VSRHLMNETKKGLLLPSLSLSLSVCPQLKLLS
jgi:hypothetical protein